MTSFEQTGITSQGGTGGIQAADEPDSRIMTDPFGRRISYLRVSVTDRCDFRCYYCMSENMSFLRRKELLSLEELDRLCSVFVRKGVRKIRLTGGEPLVRKNVLWLARRLGRLLQGGGLDELTMTSNGSQLAEHAAELADCGMKRINISLDTLKPDVFRQITRRGDFNKVMAGIDAALAAGFRIKINTVALKDNNEDEIPDMVRWAHGKGMDMTLIETMPLGDIGGDRTAQYLPLDVVRQKLAGQFTMTADSHCSGGPARFYSLAETGGRLGFITPMSHSFCESCNRVRLTSTGTLYMCLGQDDATDLRSVMRSGADDETLEAALDAAIARKPKGHDFVIDRSSDKPALSRHMSVTGG